MIGLMYLLFGFGALTVSFSPEYSEVRVETPATHPEEQENSSPSLEQMLKDAPQNQQQALRTFLRLPPASQEYVDHGETFLRTFPRSALAPFVHCVLANSYVSRFMKSRDPSDFGYFIRHGEAALQDWPGLPGFAQLKLSTLASLGSHYHQTDPEKARRYASEAIRLFEDQPDLNNQAASLAHQTLGSIEAEQSRVAESISHYQKALVIQPDNQQARYDLAKVYAQELRIEEAEAEYRTVEKAGGPLAERARGNLERLGKVQDSLDRLKESTARLRELGEDLRERMDQADSTLPEQADYMDMFFLEVEGEVDPQAEIYTSRQPTAWIIRSSRFSEVLLLRPRTNRVEALPPTSLEQQSDLGVRILPGSQVREVGKFEIQTSEGSESALRWQMDERDFKVVPRPALLGTIAGKDLRGFSPLWEKRFQDYQPDEQLIRRIRVAGWKARVIVYTGTWCGGCRVSVPRILKVQEEMRWSLVHFEYFGLPRAFGDQPRATQDRIEFIPTAVVFVDGKEIGRIEGDQWDHPEVRLHDLLSRN